MLIGPVKYEPVFDASGFHSGGETVDEFGIWLMNADEKPWQSDKFAGFFLAVVVDCDKARKTNRVAGYVVATAVVLDELDKSVPARDSKTDAIKTPMAVEIVLVGVDKRHQKRKIARLLMASVIEQAIEAHKSEADFYGVVLYAEPEKSDYYKKLGFEERQIAHNNLFLPVERVPELRVFPHRPKTAWIKNVPPQEWRAEC